MGMTADSGRPAPTLDMAVYYTYYVCNGQTHDRNLVRVVVRQRERNATMLGHRKLDVYRVSRELVAWSYRRVRKLRGVDRAIRDQLVRASQSVTLNIAEGNGKRSEAERRRFFDIARASALECSAVLDILVACGISSEHDVSGADHLVVRLVSMLTKLMRLGDDAA